MPSPEDYEFEYGPDLLAIELPEDTSVIEQIFKTAAAMFEDLKAGDLKEAVLQDLYTKQLGILSLFRAMEAAYNHYRPDTEDEGELMKYRMTSVPGKSLAYCRKLFIALRLADEEPSALSDEAKKHHKELFASYFKG